MSKKKLVNLTYWNRKKNKKLTELKQKPEYICCPQLLAAHSASHSTSLQFTSHRHRHRCQCAVSLSASVSAQSSHVCDSIWIFCLHASPASSNCACMKFCFLFLYLVVLLLLLVKRANITHCNTKATNIRLFDPSQVHTFVCKYVEIYQWKIKSIIYRMAGNEKHNNAHWVSSAEILTVFFG